VIEKILVNAISYARAEREQINITAANLRWLTIIKIIPARRECLSIHHAFRVKYSMALKDQCPGSREIRNPYPEEITCFWCERVSEIWSDEVEIVCKGCGKTISREMKPTCIEWCPAARECIGQEKYERLMKNRAK
jgi:hypothetical protein